MMVNQDMVNQDVGNQGNALIAQGVALIAQGNALIAQGNALVVQNNNRNKNFLYPMWSKIYRSPIEFYGLAVSTFEFFTEAKYLQCEYENLCAFPYNFVVNTLNGALAYYNFNYKFSTIQGKIDKDTCKALENTFLPFLIGLQKVGIVFESAQAVKLIFDKGHRIAEGKYNRHDTYELVECSVKLAVSGAALYANVYTLRVLKGGIDTVGSWVYLPKIANQGLKCFGFFYDKPKKEAHGALPAPA